MADAVPAGQPFVLRPRGPTADPADEETAEGSWLRRMQKSLRHLSALCALELAGRACAAVSVDPTIYPQLSLSLSPQSGGCSTFNSAGARMCQASVTNSRSRVMSMRSSRTITSGDQS